MFRTVPLRQDFQYFLHSVHIRYQLSWPLTENVLNPLYRDLSGPGQAL